MSLAEIEALYQESAFNRYAELDTANPFGLETIYYSRLGTKVECSGNLRELASKQPKAGQLDAAAIYGYLCFSYVPAPSTIYSEVRAVPAGSRFSVSVTDIRLEPTVPWRETDPLALDETIAVAELERLLRSALARNVSDHDAVGVYLSGGLDSSLIAALLLEAGIKPKLFTLDFGTPWDEELSYARCVAEHLNLPLVVVPAGAKQVRSAVEPAIAAMNQPFGDAVTVPLYLLGKAAAQEVSVVFNGEGGDQLFGGWINKPMIAAEIFSGKSYDRERGYLETFHRFFGLERLLFTQSTLGWFSKIDPGEWIRPPLVADGFPSLLHRLRAANLMHKGAQNIVPRMRQLAECHGLQVRAPFFDAGLAAWTFSLSPEWFLSGSCEKYLLKRVAERYLPEKVVWREKRGMGVPVLDWCLGPLKREVRRRLNPKRIKADGWFDPAFVASLCKGEDVFEDFRRRRLGEKLWALYTLHTWMDLHGMSLRAASF